MTTLKRSTLLLILLPACNALLPFDPPPETRSDLRADGPSAPDAAPDGPTGCDPSSRPDVVDPCREAVCRDNAWVVAWRSEGQSCTAPSGGAGRCFRVTQEQMTCCDGCWEAATRTCRLGTTDQYCGAQGAACQSCSSPQCGSASCQAGTCLATNEEGKPCNDANGETGLCHGGSCCTGCWDPNVGSCEPGTTTAACGTAGADCVGCAIASSDCKDAACSGGTCGVKSLADGSPCQISTGTCYGGKCCTGCWDPAASVCRAGTSETHCGANGAFCKPCATPICLVFNSCNAGVCDYSNDLDGTNCPGGRCVGGLCCDGCISGIACIPSAISSSDTRTCGLVGEACDSCNSCAETCNSGVCKSRISPLPEFTSCNDSSGISGRCTLSGTCCTGCLDAATEPAVCLPGNTNTHCGGGGVNCAPCGPGQTCFNGTCAP